MKWCGTAIGAEGYRLDPRSIEGIRNMDYSSTADETFQSAPYCRWMSDCIPDFHRMAKPPSEILNKAYKLCGERRNAALKSVALPKMFWCMEQESAFLKLNEALKKSSKTGVFEGYPWHHSNHGCTWKLLGRDIYPSVSIRAEEGGCKAAARAFSLLSGNVHHSAKEMNCLWEGSIRNGESIWKGGFLIVKGKPIQDIHQPQEPIAGLRTYGTRIWRTQKRFDKGTQAGSWYVLSRFVYWAHTEHNNVFADLLTGWWRGHRVQRAACESMIALNRSIQIKFLKWEPTSYLMHIAVAR